MTYCNLGLCYIVFGFIFGLCIPYIARRFEKFMPATFAYGVYRIFKPNKVVSREKRKATYKYWKLMKEYRMYSLGFGIATASITALAFFYMGAYLLVWKLLFIWTLLLLLEVDKRMMLLPDILTIPLLLFGFLYVLVGSQWIVFGDSVFGAMAGYFLPAVASIFLVWKDKNIFGGGDIKLLAAVGAWVGLEKLLYVIILSCLLFGAYAILRKKREGAFGPAIVSATLIVIFVFF